MAKARPASDVLKYSAARPSQAVVRRHYAKYRQAIGLAVCCDTPDCPFHRKPLLWNGAPLPVILDHISGVRNDNRPKNLRYLCPNCDSQLHTKGGANKGRVRDVSLGGYVIASRDGRLNYTLVAESDRVSLSGHPPSVIISKVAKKA